MAGKMHVITVRICGSCYDYAASVIRGNGFNPDDDEIVACLRNYEDMDATGIEGHGCDDPGKCMCVGIHDDEEDEDED